jgi:hypothetical protein
MPLIVNTRQPAAGCKLSLAAAVMPAARWRPRRWHGGADARSGRTTSAVSAVQDEDRAQILQARAHYDGLPA